MIELRSNNCPWQINKSFLEDLSEVVEAVESVHTAVSTMKSNCAEMRSTLDATKAKTRDLIAQTNRLREEGETLASQEKQLDAFVAKYQGWEHAEQIRSSSTLHYIYVETYAYACELYSIVGLSFSCLTHLL